MNRIKRQEQQSLPIRSERITSEESLDELQHWIADVTELGVPHFGELGYRLGAYRDVLAGEFADEERWRRIRGPSDRRTECETEMDALSSQHGQFLDELQNLVTKLHHDEPLFESWQEAVRQFNELQTEIERHNGRERQLTAAMAKDTNAE